MGDKPPIASRVHTKFSPWAHTIRVNVMQHRGSRLVLIQQRHKRPEAWFTSDQGQTFSLCEFNKRQVDFASFDKKWTVRNRIM